LLALTQGQPIRWCSLQLWLTCSSAPHLLWLTRLFSIYFVYNNVNCKCQRKDNSTTFYFFTVVCVRISTARNKLSSVVDNGSNNFWWIKQIFCIKCWKVPNQLNFIVEQFVKFQKYIKIPSVKILLPIFRCLFIF
jgi:hypothetical protein